MEAATRHALDEFFSAHEQRALLMARSLLGNRDDALDLVQESMLRLVRHYRDRDPADWAPLFHRILQNVIRDHLRMQRVRRWLGGLLPWQTGDGAAAGQPSPEDQVTADDELGRINRALATLPLRQQQVFLLRAWQEYSTQETAFTLGISANSVKTHFARANSRPRQLLGDNHE